MSRGGYRKPANPAPVSGPGALAQRTDGGPGQPMMQTTGGAYGEAKAFREQQAAAPMAQASDGRSAPPTPGASPSIIPLDAPTSFPQEPITTGAPFGFGPGPGARQQYGRLSQTLQSLLGDDISGDIEELFLIAEANGL